MPVARLAVCCPPHLSHYCSILSDSQSVYSSVQIDPTVNMPALTCYAYLLASLPPNIGFQTDTTLTPFFHGTTTSRCSTDLIREKKELRPSTGSTVPRGRSNR
ncbi:unnamed protein product [Protopolystoma xenopodis]|uniref:Uncharacterized protein n=1 Tax=Protopolystoma xenopodis TaxID=117903 RepID=A0A3S4ZD25_9PLAT|nr:unnamed protein product [Protopolystoma xenopodis]